MANVAAKVFGVLVDTGSRNYRQVEGYSALWTERDAAEACADKARENAGWKARVVSRSLTKAAQDGWIAGLSSDARYQDLRRMYGDNSAQVSRHLAGCAATQARGANHT